MGLKPVKASCGDDVEPSPLPPVCEVGVVFAAVVACVVVGARVAAFFFAATFTVSVTAKTVPVNSATVGVEVDVNVTLMHADGLAL